MTNVNGVHPPLGPQPAEPVSPAAPIAATGGPTGISDVVEISAAAALAAQVHQIPDVRADLVARVRAEIAAGTFETPERLEVAVERLLDDLFPNVT